MKKYTISSIFLFLSILLLNQSVFSQDSFKGNKIKGTVIEKSSGKALESATVQVFKSGDSALIGGILTDSEGKFEVSDITDGSYTVKITYVGYSTAIAKNVKVDNSKKEINLGTISLEASSETTEEIKVEDEAPQMTFEAGKKIYDAKKDLTAQNGNALDLLKNVPSVDVDNDGNVSLRGAGNVKILIDGKPSAMLSNGTQALQNIPANLIEKVEIINNPSAKYEAEGVSGIINLIMKPNDNLGYNGNIKANSGTQDKYNISMGGSVKKGKFTVNGNYSYWNYLMPGSSLIDRTLFSSTASNNIITNLDWHYKGISHYGAFGADYDFDKFNTLSLVANYFNFDRHIVSKNTLNVFDINRNNTFNNIAEMDDGRNGYNFDATLTYTKKFEEKGRDFTTFLNYSGRKENSPVSYKNYLTNSVLLQEKFSDFKFNFLNWQADYVHPFGEISKLETGVKSDLRNISGNYTFNNFDGNSGTSIPDPGRTNDADYKDWISAFYGTFSGGYKDFSYQAGLRGEYTYIDFSILQGTQKYNNKYFDLFPSVSLSQKLGTENQFQFSYSRRINRPQLNMLNPFVEQFDAYTKRTGNPYLKPEYTNSLELGYIRSLNFATVTLTGFYRNTKNDLNFLSTVDTNGVSLMYPENAGTSNSKGLELILQGSLSKWWTFNGNYSYFNTNIFNNDGINNFDKTYNSWTTRLSTSASIPEIADLQLTYFYFGKQATSQGDIEPNQMVNLSISKSFFDKKLVLGFRVNDLFNQLRFNLQLAGNDFTQRIWQKQSTRTAFLTLTFNFGEQFSSKSQKTAQRKQRESEGEIQQTGN
ncbi:MAG TPA: outer membrane beta-barrel family protein [Ignavibacteria bacterium]